MTELERDIFLVQNPAIGAAILWRFTCGYYEANKEFREVPFPLLFLVLPIVFREDFRNVIGSTYASSGLQKVAKKLYDTKCNDWFFNIQDLAVQYREITLKSFKIALQTELIDISCETAMVVPIQIKKSGFPSTSDDLLKIAEKLGKMCAPLSLHEISVLLKVRF